jgi:Txe/YoeB family toxin of Txe-Axe toxin-antitoxin module
MIKVVPINEKVREKYQRLNDGRSEDVLIFKRINRAVDRLQEDPNSGIQIRKENFPKEYLKKYRIDNLWKFDLSDEWRLTYSVVSDGVDIVVLIIEWLDHREYDRRFGYG